MATACCGRSPSQLGDSVRAQDLVARLGSDEFSIVLTPMRDTSAVSVVADKIVQQVRTALSARMVTNCG